MKQLKITIKGQTFQVKAEELKGQIWFHFDGHTFVLDKKKARQKADSLAKQRDQGRILSPMPGRIVQVAICSGQEVREDEVLFVLSSMKMEYIIRAPGQGQVKSVQVGEGDQVSAEQLLAEILNCELKIT